MIEFVMLSINSLQTALKLGNIAVSGLNEDQLVEPCLELSFGDSFWSYDPTVVLDSQQKNYDKRQELILDDDRSVLLKPGMFLLNTSYEKVTLSEGFFGMISTRGSFAQIGIQLHTASFHINPGFSANVTFEISNVGTNAVRLYAKQPAAKLYIFEVV